VALDQDLMMIILMVDLLVTFQDQLVLLRDRFGVFVCCCIHPGMEINYATHFHRRTWGEAWDYPGRSLVNLDKSYPFIGGSYIPAETDYNGGGALIVSRQNYWLGPVVSFLYLLFVWIGPKLMENRKPFSLRTPLKYWNLCLALFSFCGMVRVLPHLIHVLVSHGWDVTICTPPVFTYGHGACGLWVMLFIYSKYFELLDTAFIVFRKKQLSFLHWYHHLTVLLYTWDAYAQEQPPGIYFVAMNYTVHAIMYFYYFLAAAMKSPPKWAVFVTILQISQMFIGVYVTGWGLYYSFNFPQISYMEAGNAFEPLKFGCAVARGNLYGGCLMYSTYFYLFAKFFAERYFFKKRQQTTPVEKKERIEGEETERTTTSRNNSKPKKN